MALSCDDCFHYRCRKFLGFWDLLGSLEGRVIRRSSRLRDRRGLISLFAEAVVATGRGELLDGSPSGSFRAVNSILSTLIRSSEEQDHI